jgi:hypothetical protein
MVIQSFCENIAFLKNEFIASLFLAIGKGRNETHLLGLQLINNKGKISEFLQAIFFQVKRPTKEFSISED